MTTRDVFQREQKDEWPDVMTDMNLWLNETLTEKKSDGEEWKGRCNRNSPTFSIIPYDINIVAGINGDTLSSSYNYNPSISLLLLRSIMSLEVIVWHWEHDEPLHTHWYIPVFSVARYLEKRFVEVLWTKYQISTKQQWWEERKWCFLCDCPTCRFMRV